MSPAHKLFYFTSPCINVAGEALENEGVFVLILLLICRMMPASGIVPIPCADAVEGVVQSPANSKCPSKLSGAWARRAVRRKVLEHVAPCAFLLCFETRTFSLDGEHHCIDGTNCSCGTYGFICRIDDLRTL